MSTDETKRDGVAEATRSAPTRPSRARLRIFAWAGLLLVLPAAGMAAGVYWARLMPPRLDDAVATGKPTTPKSERKILYYWDPMLGPSSISNKPGKSAMGMDMVPVYADEVSGGTAVRIDPALVQNMGIRTAEVTRGPLQKTLRAYGVLALPAPGIHEINLRVGGWIEKLYADQEGMHIHKGEPLFELYSPDLQVAEEELIAAARGLRDLDPKADESMHREAEDFMASTQRKLSLLGLADEDIAAIAASPRAPRTVVFRSPATGHLEDKMVVQGAAVQAGMKVMRIADHSVLWLEAQVYEDQISQVKLGQRVEATVDGIPDKTFTGPITFIHPHLDPMTHTLMVRVTLDNPNLDLKPGMYAMARILTQPIADALQVPREAVIDTGERQIAFVVPPGSRDEGRFEPRRVRMGMMGDGDRVQILEGLRAGETVVTSGQFLLDVESRTTEAIEKVAAERKNHDRQNH